VNGHLIPDFAIRRLKKDGTGFLRSQDPNRRVQDGVKEPLLCEDCDGRRFSDAETSFASRIFHPFLDGQALQFDCSEADRYFIASLVWRAVVSRLRDPAADDADYLPEDLAAMEDAAGRLRRYLLGEERYPDELEQHVLFWGPDGHGQFLGLNAYLNMANDLQIVGSTERLYAYAILGAIVIASPLRLPAGFYGSGGAEHYSSQADGSLRVRQLMIEFSVAFLPLGPKLFTNHVTACPSGSVPRFATPFEMWIGNASQNLVTVRR
jgi:hypothetical protein